MNSTQQADARDRGGVFQAFGAGHGLAGPDRGLAEGARFTAGASQLNTPASRRLVFTGVSEPH